MALSFLRSACMALVTFSLTLLVTPSAMAMDSEPHENIQAAVEAFLKAQSAGYGNEPVITVGHIDSRLRLQACAEPLEAYLPAGGRTTGNVTVGVRCAGPKPWSLIVQAKVAVMERVVVSVRPLQRGEVLRADDLELAERDLASLRGGYYRVLDEVVGMKLKRSLGVGLPLQQSMLALPIAVRRGDKVSIRAMGGGLDVRMQGEALESGARGETIRVRNLSSKRELEARVAGPGQVEVDF